MQAGIDKISKTGGPVAGHYLNEPERKVGNKNLRQALLRTAQMQALRAR
jgi:hypothetical protein